MLGPKEPVTCNDLIIRQPHVYTKRNFVKYIQGCFFNILYFWPLLSEVIFFSNELLQFVVLHSVGCNEDRRAMYAANVHQLTGFLGIQRVGSATSCCKSNIVNKVWGKCHKQVRGKYWHKYIPLYWKIYTLLFWPTMNQYMTRAYSFFISNFLLNLYACLQQIAFIVKVSFIKTVQDFFYQTTKINVNTRLNVNIVSTLP